MSATEKQAMSAAFEMLVDLAGRVRGTPRDAPRVRQLLDALAWRAPDDEFGEALYKWAEEVTRIVENAVPRVP